MGKAVTVEEVIMHTLDWCTETVIDSHKWEKRWFVLKNIDTLTYMNFLFAAGTPSRLLIIKIHRDRNNGVKDCFALELLVAVIQFPLSILVVK